MVQEMRRLLITLMLTGMAVLCYAQQGLSVESFRYLEKDLTALTHETEREDQNGNRAALIKIVTPERGFVFDGGMLGVVDVVEQEGEIWLYVPPRSRHLSITHRYFGKLSEYEYPVEIVAGRTYEMRLDIGTGRYVNITTSVNGASVVVDGRNVGVSPVYNHYLTFGKHSIDAVSGNYEGSAEIDVTQNTEKGVVLMVSMNDISPLLGEVVVDVDNGADIFYGGQRVSSGVWRTQLKEGEYVVSTALPDCDTVRTSFKVIRQQQNMVKANAPIPHTGFLRIYSRPHNVTVICDGKTELDLSQTLSMTVGQHELTFSHKGYNTVTLNYAIQRGITMFDTVSLDKMKYVRPVAFYFGAAYTMRDLSGVTAVIGAVLFNNDIQLTYTFGTGPSDNVYWYDEAGKWQSSIQYSHNTLSVRYGYQFMPIQRMAITPYIGYGLESMIAHKKEGTGNYVDGATASTVGAGVKLMFVPVRHVNLFFQAGYDYAVSMDEPLRRVIDVAGFKVDGFNATAGLLLSF